MKPVVGWDYETFPISPLDLRPAPVLCSFSGGADSYHIRDKLIRLSMGNYYEWGQGEHVDPQIGDLHSGEWALVCPPEASALLETEDAIWVAHNLAFDLQVLQKHIVKDWTKFPALIESGRFRDTKIREMLWLISNDHSAGKDQFDPRTKMKGSAITYSLAYLVKARFGADISEGKKPGSWRLRYGELDGLPIPTLPYGALSYSASDSVWARRCYLDQQEDPGTATKVGSILAGDYYRDSMRQLLGDQAFGIMEDNGPQLDPRRVAKYAAGIRDLAAIADEAARVGGWARFSGCKPCKGSGKIGDSVLDLRDCELCDGGRNPLRAKPKSWPATDTKRLIQWVTHAFDDDPPRTGKGNVKKSVEVCEASGHPLLLQYAKGSAAKTALTRQVPLLEKAAAQGKLSARFNIMVRSGRTSCRNPNLQNPDSKGLFRSCFHARPGMVYVAADYSTLELYAWAQTCLELFGVSTLAGWLNDGKDVHSMMGVEIMRVFWGIEVTYEEFYANRKQGKYKQARAFAKVVNFGCPGMLTKPQSLVSYAAGMGVEISLQDAETLINLWGSQLAEAGLWSRYLRKQAGWGETWVLRQPVSGRVRAGCTSASGANSYFQGRSADFAKEVLWRIVRASKCEPGSPLYGCRPWNFVHDEFIVEGPAETVHLWQPELERIMLLPKARYFPKVHEQMKVESDVSVRWWKGAGHLKDSKGRSIPWEFQEVSMWQDLTPEWLAVAPDYFFEYAMEAQ